MSGTASPLLAMVSRPLFRLLGMALLLSGGCQAVAGFGSGAGSEGLGTGQGTVYQGFIEIGGGSLTAALELIRDGRRDVRGALQTTSGLIADGEGQLRGATLSLELSYGGDCPGRMTLEGEWDQGSGTYEGVVKATDCTGSGEGTFSFSAY